MQILVEFRAAFFFVVKRDIAAKRKIAFGKRVLEKFEVKNIGGVLTPFLNFLEISAKSKKLKRFDKFENNACNF